jgi:ankyrin repeat protein
MEELSELQKLKHEADAAALGEPTRPPTPLPPDISAQNVNARGKNTTTIPILVSYDRNSDRVLYAAVSDCDADENGNTALHVAIKQHQVLAVQYLITKLHVRVFFLIFLSPFLSTSRCPRSTFLYVSYYRPTSP